jgi:DNA-binding MarR family transcriptional regulator
MKKAAAPVSSSTDVHLLIALLRYATLIGRPMRDSVGDPADLSSNELRILIALSGEGEAAGHDLAELMGMHAMNVSRALTSLHKRKLVEAAPDVNSRRRRPYRLSKNGKAARAALEPLLADTAQFLLRDLTARERASLTDILTKLYRTVLTWQPSERGHHVPRA